MAEFEFTAFTEDALFGAGGPSAGDTITLSTLANVKVTVTDDDSELDDEDSGSETSEDLTQQTGDIEVDNALVEDDAKVFSTGTIDLIDTTTGQRFKVIVMGVEGSTDVFYTFRGQVPAPGSNLEVRRVKDNGIDVDYDKLGAGPQGPQNPGPNTPPVANDDAFDLDAVDFGGNYREFNLLANDTDINTDPLEVIAVDDVPNFFITTTVASDNGIGEFFVTTAPTPSGPNSITIGVEALAGTFEELGENETETLTLNYTISDGSDVDSATLTVTVNGINDAPEITSMPPSPIEISLTDNANPGGFTAFDVDAVDPDTNDTLFFSLTGADAAVFDIDSNGVITTNAVLVAGVNDGGDGQWDVTAVVVDRTLPDPGALSDTIDLVFTLA